MRFYEYRCKVCGTFDSTTYGERQPCPNCGASSPRFYGSVTFGAVLHEHWNPAFGTTVRSRAHAKELAKVASADQSERLGMTVDYELTDIHDHEAHGIERDELEYHAAKTAEISGKPVGA